MSRKKNGWAMGIATAFAVSLIVIGQSAIAGSVTSISNSVGGATFSNVGSHTWVVPQGVTSISVVAVGGGGAGYGSSWHNGGGGGGGLTYKSNIPVTPGESISVTVGTGGSVSGVGNGGNSEVIIPNLVPIIADGGSVGGISGHAAGGCGSGGTSYCGGMEAYFMVMAYRLGRVVVALQVIRARAATAGIARVQRNTPRSRQRVVAAEAAAEGVLALPTIADMKWALAAGESVLSGRRATVRQALREAQITVQILHPGGWFRR